MMAGLAHPCKMSITGNVEGFGHLVVFHYRNVF